MPSSATRVSMGHGLHLVLSPTTVKFTVARGTVFRGISKLPVRIPDELAEPRSMTFYVVVGVMGAAAFVLYVTASAYFSGDAPVWMLRPLGRLGGTRHSRLHTAWYRRHADAFAQYYSRATDYGRPIPRCDDTRKIKVPLWFWRLLWALLWPAALVWSAVWYVCLFVPYAVVIRVICNRWIFSSASAARHQMHWHPDVSPVMRVCRYPVIPVHAFGEGGSRLVRPTSEVDSALGGPVHGGPDRARRARLSSIWGTRYVYLVFPGLLFGRVLNNLWDDPRIRANEEVHRQRPHHQLPASRARWRRQVPGNGGDKIVFCHDAHDARAKLGYALLCGFERLVEAAAFHGVFWLEHKDLAHHNLLCAARYQDAVRDEAAAFEEVYAAAGFYAAETEDESIHVDYHDYYYDHVASAIDSDVDVGMPMDIPRRAAHFVWSLWWVFPGWAPAPGVPFGPLPQDLRPRYLIRRPLAPVVRQAALNLQRRQQPLRTPPVLPSRRRQPATTGLPPYTPPGVSAVRPQPQTEAPVPSQTDTPQDEEGETVRDQGTTAHNVPDSGQTVDYVVPGHAAAQRQQQQPDLHEQEQQQPQAAPLFTFMAQVPPMPPLPLSVFVAQLPRPAPPVPAEPPPPYSPPALAVNRVRQIRQVEVTAEVPEDDDPVPPYPGPPPGEDEDAEPPPPYHYVRQAGRMSRELLGRHVERVNALRPRAPSPARRNAYEWEVIEPRPPVYSSNSPGYMARLASPRPGLVRRNANVWEGRPLRPPPGLSPPAAAARSADAREPTPTPSPLPPLLLPPPLHATRPTLQLGQPLGLVRREPLSVPSDDVHHPYVAPIVWTNADDVARAPSPVRRHTSIVSAYMAMRTLRETAYQADEVADALDRGAGGTSAAGGRAFAAMSELYAYATELRETEDALRTSVDLPPMSQGEVFDALLPIAHEQLRRRPPVGPVVSAIRSGLDATFNGLHAAPDLVHRRIREICGPRPPATTTTPDNSPEDDAASDRATAGSASQSGASDDWEGRGDFTSSQNGVSTVARADTSASRMTTADLHAYFGGPSRRSTAHPVASTPTGEPDATIDELIASVHELLDNMPGNANTGRPVCTPNNISEDDDASDGASDDASDDAASDVASEDDDASSASGDGTRSAGSDRTTADKFWHWLHRILQWYLTVSFIVSLLFPFFCAARARLVFMLIVFATSIIRLIFNIFFE